MSDKTLDQPDKSNSEPPEAKPPTQIDARTKIVDILTRVETRQSYTDKLLEREIDEFSDADRGLITEVVNGVLRWQYRLDWYLSQLYVGEYENLIPDVKNNLRSSAYQLMYLDKVPPYAVLNEAVEIAKNKYNQKTANLVNAILRNFLRQQKKLEYVELQLDYLDRLCVSYSHPRWMVQRWIEQFGIDETLELCKANNRRPKVTVRINKLLADEEILFRSLEEYGVAVERHPDFPEFLIVNDFSEFRKTDLLRKGWVSVQDVSTAFPVYLLDPRPSETVLDMCAAPGGKAGFILERLQGQGMLMALDKHVNRAQALAENLKRYGGEHFLVLAADATRLPTRKQFDKVLLDAPCTGLGVLSKRVDLKWKRTLQDIENMQKLQNEMLNSAAGAVKPGGLLVYSTCTIEREENEEVIEQFLGRRPQFRKESLEEIVPHKYLWDKGSIRTFPHKHGMDGSFAVRLRKTE